VADCFKLALLHLIRAVLGRLFRRAARDRSAASSPARPQQARNISAGSPDAAQTNKPSRRSHEPRKSLMFLLPDSLQFRLNLVALPKSRAPKPPQGAEPLRPVQAKSPAEPARLKYRWETLGRYRLGPPPTDPADPKPGTASRQAASRRSGRSWALLLPAAPPSRRNDAARRPRRPQTQPASQNRVCPPRLRTPNSLR
jgi:hypothetical protein